MTLPDTAPPELATIRDFVRYGLSRFEEAGVHYGHGFDNGLDEAVFLVLRALQLPPDLPGAYGDAALTADERTQVYGLIVERIRSRKPAAYLLGEAWFCSTRFVVSEAVLVPRSPIAELINNEFEPWVAGNPPERILDLCTGSGCIGIATAMRLPDAHVDAVDLSEAALEIARRNAADHGVDDRVELLHSDGFDALTGRRYQLILSNPPYVGVDEYNGLPSEYQREPALGLLSGDDGLDLPLRILAEAPDYLDDDGLLILEVGASDAALCELLPSLPGVWIEFEHGGSGVIALRRDELLAIADDVASARTGRSR